jgi:hypothetical protein
VPDQDRRGQRPAAGLGEQDRTVDAHHGGQLALELVDATGQLANAPHQLGGDAHARGAVERSQPPRNALECARSVQVAGRDTGLKIGTEIDQVPAQAVDDAGALGHQVLAVVTQQADLQRAIVQKRGREPIDPFAQHGARDRPRVDLVGLARLTLAAARGAHQLRRNARDALAGAEERLLKPAGEPAAVLDRPHPVVRQRARPAQHAAVAVLVGPGLELCHQHPGAGIDGGEHVRALVGIRPDHDH